MRKTDLAELIFKQKLMEHEILDLIDRYWKFDNDQTPVSNLDVFFGIVVD